MCEHGTGVPMPINGRVREIDACLALLVATLNTVPAFETLASCCGHGHLPPRIDLADGRVLVLLDRAKADEFYGTFGVNIHGEPRPEPGEVSEAMLEAAMQEFCAQQGESYAALMSNASAADKAEMRDDWRHILRAALAAQQRTP